MQVKTLIILIIMNALLLLVFYLVNRRIKKQRNLRQLQSIRLNAQLKALLLNIQKQRGLCSRYLNGETLVKGDIQYLYADNARTINAIEYAYSQLLNHDNRWACIRQDWAELKAESLTMTAEQSFLAHNQLIENIIFMMGDVADREHNDLQILIAHDEIKMIWANIPQTLEAMGKARAIGSGVASAGVCSQANKIKLKYLSDEIIRNHAAVSKQLSRFSTEQINDMAQDIDRNINGLLNVVNTKLLAPRAPEIAADAYFTQATQAMDVVSQLYDKLSNLKERQLENSQ